MSAKTTASRCTERARTRGDVLAGTALPTKRYLLIEDDGPWGSSPHPTGSLPSEVAAHLHDRAQSLRARLLLIRRPGRHRVPEMRTWGFCDVTKGTLRWGAVHLAEELTTVDLAGSGSVGDDDVYLVCTQGRHDVCCAIEGRPVAATFAERVPDRTWECSHVGGDRFAANVLVLPTGLVYGWVTPGDVERIVAAQSAGSVVPELLRGRCGLAPASQVAESAIRAALSEYGVDAVYMHSPTHALDGRWIVTGQLPGTQRRFEVHVQEHHGVVDGGLTCAVAASGVLRSWTVEEVRTTDDA